MRVDALAARARAVPPLAVMAVLLVLQLLVMGALSRNAGWSYTGGDWALAAVLVSAELFVLCGAACAIGGNLLGLIAALVWILAPPVLVWYFVAGGSPLVDFGVVFHERVLPYAYGLEAPESVAAGALLLLSAWLALGTDWRELLREEGSGGAAGAAVGAAALLHPFAWPALAAPALALAVARRPRAALAAAFAAAVLGLAALALFRHVPGIHPGWHTIGDNLDQFREFSWSRRVLEYLPLAGLVGLAIRHRPAAAFFGWLLLAVILFPLGRELELEPLMLALVPGYGVYALLTASVLLLVPSRRPAGAPASTATTT
jgi:hypothetical protein